MSFSHENHVLFEHKHYRFLSLLKKSFHLNGSPHGMCTTFRHRHRRRSSLIEIAEVEEGKAEAEETKRGARRR